MIRTSAVLLRRKATRKVFFNSLASETTLLKCFGQPQRKPRRTMHTSSSAAPTTTIPDDPATRQVDDVDDNYDSAFYNHHHDATSSSSLPLPVIATKPWLDVTAPLQVRVTSLLSAALPLHPADANSNEVYHLIKQCCKHQQKQKQSNRNEQDDTALSPLQTLTWAQDILERLVLEKKRRFQQQQQQQQHDDDPATPNREESLVGGINIKLWDMVVFGWVRQLTASSFSSSKTAPQAATAQSIAPTRMRQVMERALEEATWDQEHLQASAGGTTARNTTAAADNDNSSSWSSRNSQRTSSLPTVDIFNTYLYGLAQAVSNLPNAYSQAQAVLHQMAELHMQRGWHCRPNTKSFSHALASCAEAACSHPYRPTSAKQTLPAYVALDLLRQMQAAHAVEKDAYEEQYQKPYDAHNVSSNRRRVVTANAVAFTIVMQAMVNTISYSTKNQPRNTALRRQQKELAQHVLELLQEMIDCQDGTVAADSTAFLMALQAFAKLAASSQQSPSMRVVAAQKCESILQMRMEHLETVRIYQLHGKDATVERERLLNDLANPDNILMAYNICLHAWSKSGAPYAVEECERIFQSILTIEHVDVLPSTTSLHACLHAWSLSKNPDAADRSYGLVKTQRDMAASGLLPGNARPDFQSYNLLMLTVARSEALSGLERTLRARRLLEEMVDGVKMGTIQRFRNPAAPFTAMLITASESFGALKLANDALANSDKTEEEKTDEATVYFHDESTTGLSDHEQIYTIALKTYQEAKQDGFQLGVKPDHHLYAAVLRMLVAAFPTGSLSSAIKPHITTERESMAHAVMADAQENGQVSRLVVHAWIDALAIPQHEAMIKLVQNQRRQMPRMWSRDVPAEYRYRVFKEQNTRTEN